MITNYGEVPNENVSQYLKQLVGKTFKILPLFEEGSPTLIAYIQSYQRELIGNSYLFEQLKDEPKFITLLTTVEYLANGTYTHEICKKEVLKCTNLINEIRERLGGDNG